MQFLVFAQFAMREYIDNNRKSIDNLKAELSYERRDRCRACELLLAHQSQQGASFLDVTQNLVFSVVSPFPKFGNIHLLVFETQECNKRNNYDHWHCASNDGVRGQLMCDSCDCFCTVCNQRLNG